MGFSLALIFVSAVIVSSSGFAIANDKPFCPPPEQLYPCKCSGLSGSVTALCKDVANQDVIRDVFSKHPDWNFHEVSFNESKFNYIPSSIVENTRFEILTVLSGTLDSLFDAVPVKTPEITVNLFEVKISRGIQWKFFSNLNLLELFVRNVDVPVIGQSFKERMPEVVKVLRFLDTKTARIKDQAFQRLVNLKTLELTGGSLKKLSRDMFPRPWNIQSWSFRNQELTELPEDFFADLPNLEFFSVAGNYFTTISEEVFTPRGSSVHYSFTGNPIHCNCRVKWITSSGRDSKPFFQGTCTEPESVKGRNLLSLTEKDFNFC